MDNETVLPSESSGWMDILEVIASSMIGSGEGHNQGFLQVIELYGCREFVGHLTTLLDIVIDTLDVSPIRDDTMWS
jgi:hypothetical protein